MIDEEKKDPLVQCDWCKKVAIEPVVYRTLTRLVRLCTRCSEALEREMNHVRYAKVVGSVK